MNQAPARLLADWNRTVDALARAGERDDADAAARAVIEAGPLRAAIKALDPLTTLESDGSEVAAALAAVQDSGRRFLWQVLLAGELLDRGEEEAAHQLIAAIGGPVRFTAAAHGALAPLLAPLLAIEPELAAVLTRSGILLDSCLEILGSSASDDVVTAVAAAIESVPDPPRWEFRLLRGVAESERWDLGRRLANVVEHPYVEKRTRGDGPTTSADDRRVDVFQRLGRARLEAGDVRGAVATWHEVTAQSNLYLELGKLVNAGYRQEFEELLAAMPEERRDKVRGWFEERLDASEPEEPEEPAGPAAELAREVEALQAAALAGDDDGVRQHLERARRLAAAIEEPSAGLFLARAELAAGELEAGSRRLLEASNLLEDHDQAYDEISEAVQLVAEQGKLDDLLAALPEPSRKLSLHWRLVEDIAFKLALAGETEKALAAAGSQEDEVFRQSAYDSLVAILLDRGCLAEAERASLAASVPSSELCEVAAVYARRGDRGQAKRLFDLALELSERPRHQSVTLAAAGRFGFDDGVRARLAADLDTLIGEPLKTVEHLIGYQRRAVARWFETGFAPRRSSDLDDPVLPSESGPDAYQKAELAEAEATMERLARDPKTEAALEKIMQATESLPEKPAQPEPPKDEPPDHRVRSASRRTREHAARGQEDEARTAFAEALAAFEEVRRESDIQEYDLVTHLTVAAVAAGETEGPFRDLLSELVPLGYTSGQAGWRRNLSWSLTDLGDWKEAFAIAYGIDEVRERYDAMSWLAINAPIEFLCLVQGFLEDDPVRTTLLGRLGSMDERAKRRVEAMLEDA